MRATSSDFADHLGDVTTSVATCWKIIRRDGMALGFTTHDRIVMVDGFSYRPSSAFTPTNISGANNFAVDELEVTGILSDEAITADDLVAGLYDGAMIEIFLVNWEEPDHGIMRLKTGWIGDVQVGNGVFTAALRGLGDKLTQSFGAVYSPECRADFGDGRCRVSLAALEVMRDVTVVIDQRRFQCLDLGVEDNWFDYGVLHWVSGENAGQSFEIKRQTGATIELYDAMPKPIGLGDLFLVTPGCDKRFVTCRTKYANAENFRGEPHIPGSDAMFTYPGLK